jgi:cysteine synthase A
MALFNNILETIGKTPLVRLKKIEEKYNLNNEIYAKLESFNPTNNVKVRPAFYMIRKLYEQGRIKTSSTIVEASSGNTGIGLAMVGAFYDNPVIIVMPESVSKERVDVLKQYGARVILTDKTLGIKGSETKVNELLEMNKDYVQPSQFTNLNNPLSHYQTTAIEIEDDLKSLPDYVFSGIGTGGTITGIGRYFKEKNSQIKILGIEPEGSAVITKGISGPHKIQGIGAGFIPDILDLDVIDEVLRVDEDLAYEFTRLLPRVEGISAGISSGAALAATIDYLKKNRIVNKRIVIIFPDSGEKYFSTGVFD